MINDCILTHFSIGEIEKKQKVRDQVGSTKECPCSKVREGMFTWIPNNPLLHSFLPTL